SPRSSLYCASAFTALMRALIVLTRRTSRAVISSRNDATTWSTAGCWTLISGRLRQAYASCDAQAFEQLVDVGVDLDHLPAVFGELRRLQAGAGDEEDDTVGLADPAPPHGLAQRTEGGAGRALAEDTAEL